MPIDFNFMVGVGGEAGQEVLAQAAKHAKEVYGYTDEQLNDLKMIEQLKAIIKQA